MLEVLKQALEAWQTSVYGSDKHHKAMLLAMTKMNQAIKELESQEPDKYEMDIECTKCGAKQSGVLTVNTHPPQRTEQEQPLPPVEIGVDVTADGASVVAFYRRPNAVMEMFYSQFHPAPQRTWVGLTDEEITALKRNGERYISSQDFARAIEAKLKQKNGYVAQETNS